MAALIDMSISVIVTNHTAVAPLSQRSTSIQAQALNAIVSSDRGISTLCARDVLTVQMAFYIKIAYSCGNAPLKQAINHILDSHDLTFDEASDKVIRKRSDLAISGTTDFAHIDIDDWSIPCTE